MYDCQTDTEEELVIEFCYVVTTLYTAAVRPCAWSQEHEGHAVAMLYVRVLASEFLGVIVVVNSRIQLLMHLILLVGENCAT